MGDGADETRGRWYSGYREISLINLINAPSENKSRPRVGVHLFNFFGPFVLPPGDVNHASVSSAVRYKRAKINLHRYAAESFLNNANPNRR